MYKMKISERTKNIIDILQWILIIISIGACFYIYFNKKETNTQEIIQEQNDRYVKIYDSQRIASLEKENKELYDSIQKLKNVESAIQIKYVYKYSTDTVFVPVKESVLDSIYNYTYDNDTLKYYLTIKADRLEWHKTRFELHDKFTIININDNDRITTVIDHSPNVDIENTTTWHKKRKFIDNIYYGPSVSVGYGVFNKKPDLFVGFSVGYNFNWK